MMFCYGNSRKWIQQVRVSLSSFQYQSEPWPRWPSAFTIFFCKGFFFFIHALMMLSFRNSFFFFFFLWGGGFCGAPCGEFLQQVSCLSKYKLLQHQSTRVNNRFNAGLLCWILIFLSFLASKDFPLFITSEAIMLKSGVVWCGVEWWW